MHGRLAHVGQSTTHSIHEHVIGIDRPLKQNAIYKCASCLPNKMCKQPHHRTSKHNTKRDRSNTEDQDTHEDDILPAGTLDQYFHMNFGFVRGSEFKLR